MRLAIRLTALVWLSFSACGGGDEAAGIDRAKVDAAPQKYKDACQAVCTAADTVRGQGCGQVQYSTHDGCYLHCVDDYLRLPQCEAMFDDANNCIVTYLCQAATLCQGKVIFAALCRDQNSGAAP